MTLLYLDVDNSPGNGTITVHRPLSATLANISSELRRTFVSKTRTV
jgi:hypothetical protein